MVLYNTDDCHERKETQHCRAFDYEKLVSRYKANFDIFWLRDKSFQGSEALQPPDLIAAKIAQNLQMALEQFSEIHEELRVSVPD